MKKSSNVGVFSLGNLTILSTDSLDGERDNFLNTDE